MSDSTPERQAYSSVHEEGYEGRFAANIADIRLFKDNPYISNELTASQREVLNNDLLEPYNGEMFYDDDKNIWICNVVQDSQGAIRYEYTSKDIDLKKELDAYKSKGVINQLMSAYNNGQIYKFYYNVTSNKIFPNSSLVFPEEYNHYTIRKQTLNSNANYVYVAGVQVPGPNNQVDFITKIGMRPIRDTQNNVVSKRMNVAELVPDDVENGYGRLENGLFYVVDFFDIDNNLINTILFQAVEAVVHDTQVPSAAVVDLKIVVYREGIDLKSATNIYPIYPGEDLTKNVSFSVIAIYNDGTEKVITDKRDTPQLDIDGLDENINNVEGEKHEVVFTYYPNVDAEGLPVGSAITKSVFFQVTTYKYAKLYRIIPVIWKENVVDLHSNGTPFYTFKLKVYVLTEDGTIENRTRSFYNTMKFVNNENAAVDINENNLPAIYSYDPYNQNVSFTFISGSEIANTTFQFSTYNNDSEKQYRFIAKFGVLSTDTTQNINDNTFVAPYASAGNINVGYGYAAGDVFSSLSDVYSNMDDGNIYNKAAITAASDGSKQIELELNNTTDTFANRFARTINGTRYTPDSVILFAVKDSSYTPLNGVVNISAGSSSTNRKLIIPLYNTQTVNKLLDKVSTFDYILAQFRYSPASGTDNFITDFCVFSVVNSLPRS